MLLLSIRWKLTVEISSSNVESIKRTAAIWNEYPGTLLNVLYSLLVYTGIKIEKYQNSTVDSEYNTGA